MSKSKQGVWEADKACLKAVEVRPGCQKAVKINPTQAKSVTMNEDMKIAQRHVQLSMGNRYPSSSMYGVPYLNNKGGNSVRRSQDI